MKKRFGCLLVCALLIFNLFPSGAFAERTITIYINNQVLQSDVAPVISNNRTFIPFRAISEALNARIEWDPETRSVFVEKNNKAAMLTIGETYVLTVTSEEEYGEIILDAPPFIKDGRTLAPVRAISEFFGCRVSWDDATSSVIIETPDGEITLPQEPTVPQGNQNQSGQIGQMEAEILSIVNQERAKEGLNPLSYAFDLEKLAYDHSADMANRNYFDHVSPEGITPSDRVSNAGIDYRRTAENIAAGQQSAYDVMTSWMNSPGHRRNILDPNLEEIGIGYYEGGSYGKYYTQVFVTR